MKHIHASSAGWVKGKGYSKRVVIGTDDLGIPGSFMQEVAFKKGDVVPLHHHSKQTEIFYAIDEAFFEINGEKVVMEPGDVVVCEPGDVHGNPVIPKDFKILVFKIRHSNDDIHWEQ